MKGYVEAYVKAYVPAGAGDLKTSSGNILDGEMLVNEDNEIIVTNENGIRITINEI